MTISSRVQPISKINSSIKIANQTYSVDPLLLFQIISLAKKSNSELKTTSNTN